MEQNGGISDRKLMMNKEIRAIKEIAVLVELKLKVLDFHVVAKHLLIAWGQ
jgi:hypothetical protein